MFGVLAMRQLRLVILQTQAREVLHALGPLEAVEFKHSNAGPTTAPMPAPDHAEALKGCAERLGRVDELLRTLEISVLPPPGQVAPAPPSEDTEAQLAAIEKRAAVLLSKRREKLDNLKNLNAACEQLLPYRGAGVPLDNPAQLQFVHIRTGRVPLCNYEKLARSVGTDVILLPLPTLGTQQPLVALTAACGGTALERVLAEAGFEAAVLPTVSGATVDGLAATKLSEQAAAEKDLREAGEAVEAFAREIAPKLSQIRDALRIETHLLEADRNFPRTAATVLMEGWVPAEEAGKVEQSVNACTQGRCVLQTRAPEGMPGDEIPVLLRPGKILRPFAGLVKAYGLPNYHEVEPTVFMAVSYLLMFGMMFGDAGHGIVLAGIGLGLLLRGETEKARDLGRLLLGGGLACFAGGVLYGSWFGLAQFKKFALWCDPLEADPLLLIGRALRVGVLLISLGLILNIINRLRRGDFWGSLLDKFGVMGLLFYWGMLSLLTHRPFFEANGLTKVALGVFLVLPLVGWCLRQPLEQVTARQRHSASPFGAAIAESMVSAFEAVLSYLANTISFVRLAAYAMAHSALLLAVIMVAAELRKAGSLGVVFSLVVIVGGNLFVLALEGVIASVQALRLEYYEFFSKFFSGNGRAFEPFRLN